MTQDTNLASQRRLKIYVFTIWNVEIMEVCYNTELIMSVFANNITDLSCVSI
jgi:hypothetical protein